MSHGGASRGGVGVLCLAMAALGAACAHSPPPPASATVRYAVEASCSACDIESIARQLAGERALDCGHARDPRDEAARERVGACARKAEAEGVPFLAIVHWPGIDSEVIEGFVRAPDGSLSDLWYDSDVSGGGRNCSALVTRAPCGHLVPQPEWPGYLRCEPKEQRDTVCQERGYTAGPPVDASDLRCHWSKPEERPYSVCRRVEPGKGNVPPGSGLVCRQRGTERPDVFDCSLSAEGDAALGIQWERH